MHSDFRMSFPGKSFPPEQNDESEVAVLAEDATRTYRHRMNSHARRVRDLVKGVRAAGLEALVVSRSVNVAYLSGFTGGSSFLVVTPKRTILVSDHRFTIQIRDECPTIEAHLRGHQKNTYQALGELLTKLGVRNVGVEASGLSLAEYEMIRSAAPTVNFAPQGGLVETLRAIKDAGEIEILKRAVRMAEDAFVALEATLRDADSEKESADRLDGFIKRLGGTGLAFDPIVGVGDRSALPHCPVGGRAMSEADFVLFDWGAKLDHYHSDLTRVRWRRGAKPRRTVETKMRNIYTIVSEAQTRAIAKLRPGTHVKEVDAAARGTIADAGYGDFFNHGLGHGIGLEIHESPQIRSNSDDVLQAGMVVTIEPGIYLPDFGGVRLEDDILITEDGPVVLSGLDRSFDIH
jgi:Xaa-Pro aminopeptidase